MKKILPISFLLLSFFLSFISVSAQDFDYSRSLSDYLYNYNLYRSAYNEYVGAKSEYQTYQTLTSQTKSLEATKKMLLARDESLKTYLTALRMKLKDTTNILDYQQNLSYIKLDNEITWLSDHKNSLPSSGTIEDLLETSQELEKRYPQIEVLSYQTLGVIMTGKETQIHNRVLEEIKKTESKINQIKATGEDTTSLERWLMQAKEKMTRSEEKGKEAQGYLTQMKVTETNKKNVWNKAQKAFEEENQYLKEAISYLKEIVREIKRA